MIKEGDSFELVTDIFWIFSFPFNIVSRLVWFKRNQGYAQALLFGLSANITSQLRILASSYLRADKVRGDRIIVLGNHLLFKIDHIWRPPQDLLQILLYQRIYKYHIIIVFVCGKHLFFSVCKREYREFWEHDLKIFPIICH